MALSTLAIILLTIFAGVNNATIKSDSVDRFFDSYQHTISKEQETNHTRVASPDLAYKASAQIATQNSPGVVGVTAKSFAIYDRTSGEVVAGQTANQQLPIASLTKLMTALTIIENHDKDEIVTVPNLPKLSSDIAVAGITPGGKYKVHDLISAVLVSSSADAAEALALWDSKTEAAYVTKMNDTASRWGLKDTHFANVVGLDDAGNYSSAKDLVTIVSLLLQNKTIAQTVSQKSIVITDTASGGKKTLYSTNALLGRNGISGVKTGTTLAAGQCFIGRYNDGTKDILTVVLGSSDRFVDTQKMLNYSFTSLSWM